MTLPYNNEFNPGFTGFTASAESGGSWSAYSDEDTDAYRFSTGTANAKRGWALVDAAGTGLGGATPSDFTASVKFVVTAAQVGSNTAWGFAVLGNTLGLPGKYILMDWAANDQLRIYNIGGAGNGVTVNRTATSNFGFSPGVEFTLTATGKYSGTVLTLSLTITNGTYSDTITAAPFDTAAHYTGTAMGLTARSGSPSNGTTVLYDSFNLGNSYTAPPAPVAPPAGIVDINPAITHPFLIVSSGEFAEWRSRTATEPWASMKTKCLDIANNVSFDLNSSARLRNQALELKLIVSASALATILDPVNAQAHADKALAEMLAGLPDIEARRPSVGRSEWEANTPVGSCLFSCILALDVIDPHITAAQRNDVALLIEPMVASISNQWAPSGRSLRALWSIYKDRTNTSGYLANVNGFLSELQAHLTADGVMRAGTGYANARLNYYDREQKHSLGDILVRLGLDDFYSRSKLRNGYEWLYGSAYGHNGDVHVFGDSSTDRPYYGPPGVYPVDSATAAFRAWRFSTLAQSYARTLTGNVTPHPTLLAYAGTGPANRDLPATPAASRIFHDGGAFFREARIDSNALSIAMWNLATSNTDSHTHKDTNALSLIGLGEHLLTNVGYAGYGAGYAGFTWKDINDRALGNNTVFIDYPAITTGKNAPSTNDHSKRYGAGIVRGFTSPFLDYAVGDSGTALALGKHFRGLGFVQAADGQAPYAFLLDRVTSATGATTQMALHPFSPDTDPTIVANAHYRWFVKSDTAEGAYLSIFLGAPPTQVQLLDGIAANLTVANSLLGKFLFATYPIVGGEANFATVLYPHRNVAGAPGVTQIARPNFTGLELSLANNTTDTILSIDSGAGTVTNGDATLNARGAYLRTVAGSLQRFFLDLGTFFSHSGGVSLTSSQPVTAMVDASTMEITLSGAATVSVQVPGITQGFVNQGQTPTVADVNGNLSFTLGAGRQFIFWNTPSSPALDLSIRNGSAIVKTSGLIPGATYTIEGSDDLTNWQPLKSAPAVSSTDLVVEAVGIETKRFYRLVSP